MGYSDIDYINEILFYTTEMSYRMRKRKTLNEQDIAKMISLTIDLLNILELYQNDKYDIY